MISMFSLTKEKEITSIQVEVDVIDISEIGEEEPSKGCDKRERRREEENE